MLGGRIDVVLRSFKLLQIHLHKELNISSCCDVGGRIDVVLRSFKLLQIHLHKELNISSCCDVGWQNRCSTAVVQTITDSSTQGA